VLDQIMSAPRANHIRGHSPEQPTLKELYQRYGTSDDDELILRSLVPEADIEKMRAAGPVKRSFPLLSSPELEHVYRLMTLSTSKYVRLCTEAMNVTLTRGEDQLP